MIRIRALAALLPVVLIHSAVAQGTPASVTGSPPAALVGAFQDDYGDSFQIDRDSWLQKPRMRFHVVAWDSAQHYLIAWNDSTNRGDPGKWTRIDWVILPDMAPYAWGFCLSAYNAPSRAAAESTAVVHRDTPKTGCNGYPFSRMRRLP